MTKQQARARAKAIRHRLDLHTIGLAMARQLFALPCWQRARTVLAFSALPDEPDTSAILQQALADGKRLLLPRVTGNGTMDWVAIADLSLLRQGAFGILEPDASLPGVHPEDFPAPLALVPCLAVSPDGIRLGRGGGYYDRFLAHYKGERRLLCPAALVAADLPADPWDIRFVPQEILTEKGILL